VLAFNIDKYFQEFLNLYKINIFFLIILIFLSNILELFGIYLILPLIYVMTGNDIDQVFLSQIFNIEFVKNNLLVIFLLTYLIKFFFLFFVQWKLHLFIYLLQCSLSKKIIEISFFRKKNNNNTRLTSEKLLQLVVSETAVFCNQFILPAIVLLSEIMFVILMLLFLTYFYTQSTIIVLGLLILLIFLYYIIIVKKIIQPFGEQRSKFDTQRIKVLNEIILSFKEIIIYSKIDLFLNKFKKYDLKYTNTLKILGTFSQLPRLFIEIFIIGILILFLFFYQNDTASLSNILPQMALVFALILRLMPSFTRVISSFQLIQFSKKSVTNINKYFNEIEIKKIDNLVIKDQINKIENIELKNINFNFKDNVNLFEGLNLKLSKDKIVGIKGVSGSGKTTLLDILMSFYSPQKGEILINKHNLKNSKSEWISNIAYISQNTILLNDTLLKNIIFDDISQTIDYKFIEEIIKSVHLKDFVDEKKEGLNLIIGDNGQFLSSGQTQRVAIARALYSKRNFIILDEATNSLDAETEKGIFNTLSNLKKNRLIVIVTHNEKNLEFCDEIFELKNNKIFKV